MTNEELITKIKAEAERLMDEYKPTVGGIDETTGANIALAKILSFLSTLESEKPMNPDDAMKELDEKIALVKQRGTWDGVDVDKYIDEVRGREPEKPMEGLDEEIDRLWESFADEMEGPHNLFDIYARLARHFAQWGAEHTKNSDEKPVSVDLEEAAGKRLRRVCNLVEETKEDKPLEERLQELKEIRAEKDLDEAAEKYATEWHENPDGSAWKPYFEVSAIKAFIAGAKWQKEQMMKDAVEGVVCYGSKGAYIETDFLGEYNTDVYGNPGDKVRVIVLPNTDEK